MTSQVYCPIRKVWVAATPEELVRQQLISIMMHKLNYPASQLVLERSLHQMPHLACTQQNIPDRRVDLVCFAKDIHPQHSLYPLLLAECKAVPLTFKVINQVVGYNHFLKAYFVVVINAQEIRTGWFDKKKGDYVFMDGLPTFNKLIEAIKTAFL